MQMEYTFKKKCINTHNWTNKIMYEIDKFKIKTRMENIRSKYVQNI